MSKIGYVLKRVGKIDTSRMKETLEYLHKKTGKTKAYLCAKREETR